jgi:hypothetical protein
MIPEADRRGSSYRGWRWRVYVEPIGDPVEVDACMPVGALPQV